MIDDHPSIMLPVLTEKLEPIPADFKQEVGYILGRSANKATTETDSNSNHGQFSLASCPDPHVSGLWIHISICKHAHPIRKRSTQGSNPEH